MIANASIGSKFLYTKKRFNYQVKPFFLVGVAGFEPTTPAPKAGALTGLRYTPSALFLKSECKGRNYFVINKEI